MKLDGCLTSLFYVTYKDLACYASYRGHGSIGEMLTTNGMAWRQMRWGGLWLTQAGKAVASCPVQQAEALLNGGPTQGQQVAHPLQLRSELIVRLS